MSKPGPTYHFDRRATRHRCEKKPFPQQRPEESGRIVRPGSIKMVGLSRRPCESRRCQSFLKKQEETDARSYHTMELEQHVAELIEQIDNRVRLHSALGYLSPAEFESRPVPSGAVPAWLPAALSLRRHEEVPPLGQPPEGQP